MSFRQTGQFSSVPSGDVRAYIEGNLQGGVQRTSGKRTDGMTRPDVSGLHQDGREDGDRLQRWLNAAQTEEL